MRRSLVAGSLVALACLLFVAPAAALSESDWLGRINEIRAASQLPPVAEEPAWSAGIMAHLEYMSKTPSSYAVGPYASAHTENPSSPYFTEAGAHEAESSDLGGGRTNVEAINGWLAAPFHAIGMLRPALTAVAFARDPATGAAGLDVISGLFQEIPLAGEEEHPPRQVLFPGPGGTIDLTRFGGEEPTPIETCNAQHPGADYESPGLPLIALLSEPPAPGLGAALTQPNGATVAGSSPDLCVVTAQNFVTTDPIYGPTGRAILAGDNAVLVIPREALTEGTYSVDLTQPGRPDISWSFQSKPKPEPVTKTVELRLIPRRSKLRLKAVGPAKVLIGQRIKVAIKREWVPCALVLHAHRCTWVPKGHTRRRKLKLSRKTAIRIHPAGAWEKVLVSVWTPRLVDGLTTYTPSRSQLIFTGPKPHHAAR